MLEDADGSLLVIDTGGWYKLCCPTSQLAKPDVLGGDLSRPAHGRAESRRTRAAARSPGRRCSRPTLATLLDDPRPAVRNRARATVGDARGAGAVPALDERPEHVARRPRRGATPSGRSRAIDGAPARAAVRAWRSSDRDDGRAAGGAALGGPLARRGAVPQLVDALKIRLRRPCSAPRPKRSAASATARAVPICSPLAAAPLDRVLEHSLTYALIEIAIRPSTASGAAGAQRRAPGAPRSSRSIRWTAARSRPATVVPLLDSTDPVLKETAWWIAGRIARTGAARWRGSSRSG